jgi:single-strand DNA-binding protein
MLPFAARDREGHGESEEHPVGNSTTITGNLTREPEIRYTKEGQATAQLGVAVNRRWQDRSTQEWQESTSFFDVVCWRDLAENVALSLSKGMRVVVTGRLEQRSWETEEGEHRSKVEITADEIGPSLRFATADVQRTERRTAAELPESEPADGLGGGSGSVSVEA